MIDQFVAENPFRFDDEELREVASWKHAVVGDFFILRYLSNHTVFLTADKAPAKAYSVLALRDAFQVHIGFQLPRLITTVLLPFRGKIIYDGIISGFNVTFGGGTKKRLNDDYKEAKERFGIIRTIPLGDEGTKSETPEPALPKTRTSGQTDDPSHPLTLSTARRKMIAEVLPSLGKRLKLDESGMRTIRFKDNGYGFLHGVALAWHNGRLYASWGHNEGLGNTASEEARGRVSDDGGRTWSDTFTIDSGEKDGELAVSHGVFHHPRHLPRSTGVEGAAGARSTPFHRERAGNAVKSAGVQFSFCRFRQLVSGGWGDE